MKSQSNLKTDIVIYGAGFAGLCAALSLSEYVENIIILEPLNEKLYQKISQDDTRTTALSYFTKKFFEKNKLWSKLKTSCGEIRDIDIFDADYLNGDSPLSLHFKSDFVSDEAMGYIIENKNLKQTLLKEIYKKKNIEIKFDDQILSVNDQANKVCIETKNKKEIDTKLLICADGKNSKLRKLIGIKTKKKDYNQTALTFNIFHEKPHNKIAVERFMPTGPFAVLPMKNKNESSIVWTVKRETADLYLKLNKKDFLQEVAKRTNLKADKIKIISPILTYNLSLVYCDEYFKNSSVLIGDAAHGIHPIAGQGFNQGVKDIEKLYELISEKTNLGLGFDDESMLSEYQNSRRADNMQMIVATDFFNSLFSNENKILKLGRRVGISAVNKAPKIRDFFIKKAMGQS